MVENHGIGARRQAVILSKEPPSGGFSRAIWLEYGDHGDGGVALDLRILSGAQEQHGAEDGNDHDKGHFVGDLQHGGNRHRAERHVGETVADEGKPLQHQRHTQQGGAKRDQYTDNERIADKGVSL